MKSISKIPSWKILLCKSVETPKALATRIAVDPVRLKPVIDAYPMRINPYFLDLAVKAGPPLSNRSFPTYVNSKTAWTTPSPRTPTAPSPRSPTATRTVCCSP
jgi:lysine 2,3-aminomutase